MSLFLNSGTVRGSSGEHIKQKEGLMKSGCFPSNLPGAKFNGFQSRLYTITATYFECVFGVQCFCNFCCKPFPFSDNLELKFLISNRELYNILIYRVEIKREDREID